MRTTRTIRKRVVKSKVGVSVKRLGGVGDVGFMLLAKPYLLFIVLICALANNNSVKAHCEFSIIILRLCSVFLVAG